MEAKCLKLKRRRVGAFYSKLITAKPGQAGKVGGSTTGRVQLIVVSKQKHHLYSFFNFFSVTL